MSNIDCYMLTTFVACRHF